MTAGSPAPPDRAQKRLLVLTGDSRATAAWPATTSPAGQLVSRAFGSLVRTVRQSRMRACRRSIPPGRGVHRSAPRRLRVLTAPPAGSLVGVPAWRQLGSLHGHLTAG